MKKGRQMRETMQGTMMYSDCAKASKLGMGAGWLVVCTNGRKPWTVPKGAIPAMVGRATDRTTAPTKADARKRMLECETTE